jgi:hypothetical protein
MSFLAAPVTPYSLAALAFWLFATRALYTFLTSKKFLPLKATERMKKC